MPIDVQDFIEAGRDRLPGLLGVQIDEIQEGRVRMHLMLRPELLAPNGYLHAGTVVALADSACGYGCIASLPEGASGFTTVELKANFLRSAQSGDALRCNATLAHGGRTTQVWDATVTRESDRRDLALFRCTQYLLGADDARTRRQGPRA